MEWLNSPINIEKAKNIELSKIFFGGLLTTKQQILVIKEHISNLQNELQSLNSIYELQRQCDKNTLQSIYNVLIEDSYNQCGIKALSESSMSDKLVSCIFENQMATLNYGIAEVKFQISWYQKRLKELEAKNE